MPQPSQRRTCPPSAALRHCSMADITLSWARLRWPRWACAPGRAVLAEDVGDLQGGPPHGSRPTRRQVLQRADHLAQQIGGHVRVERGGLQLLVAQQHLDDADVDLLLQQVGGKAVAQRVHRHALVDLGRVGGGVDGAVELARGQRVHRVQAREQPAAAQDLALGMADAPPRAQPLQQHRAAAWRSGPCGPCPVRRAASCAGCRCRRPSSAMISLARSPAP